MRTMLTRRRPNMTFQCRSSALQRTHVRSLVVVEFYCWGNAGFGLLGPEMSAHAIRGVPTRIDGFTGPVVALASGIGSVRAASLRGCRVLGAERSRSAW